MGTDNYNFFAPEASQADVSQPSAASHLHVVRSEILFAQSNAVGILHAGEVYLLTRTRQNKLLLTKQGA